MKASDWIFGLGYGAFLIAAMAVAEGRWKGNRQRAVKKGLKQIPMTASRPAYAPKFQEVAIRHWGGSGLETKDAVRKHDSDSRLSDQATQKRVGSTCFQRDIRDVGRLGHEVTERQRLKVATQLVCDKALNPPSPTWTPRQGSRWKPGIIEVK